MPTPDGRRSASLQCPRPVVLFIEDNLTQLDLYAMLIEHEVSVIKATRGQTGLELAARERPDVIVLDLHLPDVDGFTLSEELRSTSGAATVPIIVLTGDDMVFARARALTDRFSAVLSKPCPADRLLNAIQRALRNERIRTTATVSSSRTAAGVAAVRNRQRPSSLPRATRASDG